MPICISTAIILELQAMSFEIDACECADELKLEMVFSHLLIQNDLCHGTHHPMLFRRVSVKIERGPKSGCVGTIAGTLADREFLVQAGLTKAIVRINDEFYPLEIKNLRELSQAERILLGIE